MLRIDFLAYTICMNFADLSGSIDGNFDGGGFVTHRFLIFSREMVEIVELFALALISVSPSQFGFESVVFLGQVFFSEMLGVVAATVSPLEYFRSGYICVLKVILGFVSIGTLFRQGGEATGWALRVRKGQRHSHT